MTQAYIFSALKALAKFFNFINMSVRNIGFCLQIKCFLCTPGICRSFIFIINKRYIFNKIFSGESVSFQLCVLFVKRFTF